MEGCASWDRQVQWQQSVRRWSYGPWRASPRTQTPWEQRTGMCPGGKRLTSHNAGWRRRKWVAAEGRERSYVPSPTTDPRITARHVPRVSHFLTREYVSCNFLVLIFSSFLSVDASTIHRVVDGDHFCGLDHRVWNIHIRVQLNWRWIQWSRGLGISHFLKGVSFLLYQRKLPWFREVGVGCEGWGRAAERCCLSPMLPGFPTSFLWVRMARDGPQWEAATREQPFWVTT